jgi:hypothetical protein
MLSDWSFQHRVCGAFLKIGYVNPLTSTISFDVSLIVPAPAVPTGSGVDVGKQACVRFQNNVSFLFYRSINILFLCTPL